MYIKTVCMKFMFIFYLQINTCDQNVARCCEIIELNAKVQGQLFKLLQVTAEAGKTVMLWNYWTPMPKFKVSCSNFCRSQQRQVRQWCCEIIELNAKVQGQLFKLLQVWTLLTGVHVMNGSLWISKGHSVSWTWSCAQTSFQYC